MYCSHCYNFEQLGQLLTVMFQRGRFQNEVQSEESLIIGKQRLATEQDCSTVNYILKEVWLKHVKHMVCAWGW